MAKSRKSTTGTMGTRGSKRTKSAKSPVSTSRSKERKQSRPNKRIPPKNPDGSIKISMIKREYRLVEQHGDEVIVTSHFALNKGPGDAAVKLARPFFKDRNDGSKVRITITKISDGRNKGALYEYEVLQKHMPLKPGESAPKGIVIEKNGKKYRLKRYATKLKTYTPSSQKKLKKSLSKDSAKNPDNASDSSDDKKISAQTKNKIKEILSDESKKGRVSKTIYSANKESPHTIVNHGKKNKKNNASKSSSKSSTTSDEQSHISVSDS